MDNDEVNPFIAFNAIYYQILEKYLGPEEAAKIVYTEFSEAYKEMTIRIFSTISHAKKQENEETE